MKLGLLLPNQGVVFGAVTVAELVEMAERADGMGVFDAIFVGDNLLAKPRLESVSLLSALAVRTKTARLGTACMASFPLRHPIVLAAQWAALDNLCEGRSILVACIGGGGGDSSIPGQFSAEYKAFGVETRERVGRLTEGIQVLRTLWTEDPASHHGKFFDFEGIAVRPQPVKKPCPPIWIANNLSLLKTSSETSQGSEFVGLPSVVRAILRSQAGSGLRPSGMSPARTSTGSRY